MAAPLSVFGTSLTERKSFFQRLVALVRCWTCVVGRCRRTMWALTKVSTVSTLQEGELLHHYFFSRRT
jgi:hypothetical protein